VPEIEDMAIEAQPDDPSPNPSLRDQLGRLVGELSRLRNPLSNLSDHLRKLGEVLGFANVSLLALSSEDDELAEPVLAESGHLGIAIDALLELPPLQPEFSSPPGGPALLLIPISFDGHTTSLLACTDPGAHPPSAEDLAAMSTYGQGVAPTIERAILRHQLAENERLLHARSMGELRAVKAVKTANEMRREAEGKLLHAAFHDALTGLPNRSLFMDRLAHAIRRSERQKNVVFAILCVGIDRFKVVNDSLGHNIGDQMLVSISERLQRAIRPSDTLARLGGDVFTILLEDIGNLRRAHRVTERIQNELSRAFVLGDNELFATTGIGIALSTGQCEASELLHNAELALHRAKQRGRGEKEVFDLKMHSAAIALLELETDLRKGLERHEFRVHYQPLYRLDRGLELHGFEALVRWEHPSRGLLAPAAFLEVAEESGLIVPLDDWVLRESCRQLAQWSELRGVSDKLSVNVNISDRQIHRPGLSADVFSTIDASGLDRSRVALEITENLVMEQGSRAADVLRELNEGGLHLHLDDFGTGYSSLSYLRRLPLHCLKIDRSFISKIDDNREDMAVVQAIVMLAKSLGLTVTAEGVETQKQLDIVRQLGCEFGQGYFLDKPLPADQATDLLTQA
jgi:diguanylate cyclase (GGDEF)-like protein